MKGNVIRLNIMHLNSVHLNSIGEVQSVSLKAGESTEDPVYPPTTYTLAANVSNGKVTATKNGTAISLPYVATEGDVIVLSVTPDEGYEFNGWLDGNKSNPRTVTMTGNVVLSASCVEIAKPTYTLSASVTNGKVSAKRNGSAVNLPFTANEGDTIVLEVTPNDGYTFEGWNDGNTDNPRTITMNADVALSAQCVEVVQPPVGNYIQFEDPAVEAICVANWSSDGIGITKEDAAAVTDLGAKFKGNTTITSFMELAQFGSVNILTHEEFKACSNLESIDLSNIKNIGKGAFTECSNLTNYGSLENVEILGDYAFNGTAISGVLRMPKLITLNGTNGNTLAQTNITNIADLGGITEIPAFFFCISTNLEKVTIPDSVISIQRDAFATCPKLKTLIIGEGIESIAKGILWQCTAIKSIVCKAVTPPLLAEGFVGTNSTFSIYVPDASLEAYKTATNWKQYSARIKPLSEYVKE